MTFISNPTKATVEVEVEAETEAEAIVDFDAIAQRVANSTPDPDPDLSWRQGALCRDTSPELFFPIGTTGLAIGQIEAAKAVCTTCPSQVPCLEFALGSNQDSGVWGATSEEERRHLRRTYIMKRRR